MNIGVVGLGLIGGSMAKSIRQRTDNRVYGFDINTPIIHRAVLTEVIHAPLTEELLNECDLVILALYPGDTVSYIKAHQKDFKENSVIMDCCGVKQVICSECEAMASENSFTFIGAHPMAGLEHSGFEHSREGLFNNASMVLTPAKGSKIEFVEKIKKFCISIGFTDTQITSPEHHDKVIAFTSQLAHVVSSAYIKSPTALEHKGFSAGSYKDLTRVAKLNEDMWTELFLDNKEFLVGEIDSLIERLGAYSDAIKNEDAVLLRGLLKDGKDRKIQIDNESF